MRRPHPVALGLLLVVGLSGCKADLFTRVEVHGASSSTVHAEVAFSGEAAEAIRSRPAVQAQLEQVIAARVGQAATRSDDGGILRYRVQVPYDRLVASSGVLGVKAVSLRPSSDNEHVTVTMSLVKPSEIQDQIVRAAAADFEPGALADTVAASTYVAMAVTMPGDITDARAPVKVEQQGDTVTVRQSMKDFVPGQFTVTGSTTAGVPWAAAAIGAGVLAVAGSVVTVRRRRA